MHLDRLTMILEAISIAGRALSAAELQLATELPRPTCYRMLQSLADYGLLDCSDGRYAIGERLKYIVRNAQTDHDAISIAAPILRNSSGELGETVFLARLRQKGVEIIHVEVPRDQSRSFVHPGLGPRPVHACSCSKVVAAFADENLQARLLGRPFNSYTQHTRTDPAGLKIELTQIRSLGYAECVEELEDGVSSVAAPIRAAGTDIVLSVGAVGPIRRFAPQRRCEIGAYLVDAARRIEHAFQLTLLEESACRLQ